MWWVVVGQDSLAVYVTANYGIFAKPRMVSAKRSVVSTHLDRAFHKGDNSIYAESDMRRKGRCATARRVGEN